VTLTFAAQALATLAAHPAGLAAVAAALCAEPSACKALRKIEASAGATAASRNLAAALLSCAAVAGSQDGSFPGSGPGAAADAPALWHVCGACGVAEGQGLRLQRCQGCFAVSYCSEVRSSFSSGRLRDGHWGGGAQRCRCGPRSLPHHSPTRPLGAPAQDCSGHDWTTGGHQAFCRAQQKQAAAAAPDEPGDAAAPPA
jgi:hypothetical protein